MHNSLMESVTCEEMKEIERKASLSGISYSKMMENAGCAAVDVILSKVGLDKKQGVCQSKAGASFDAIIFCGKGNNGGDGYVVARELALLGMNVSVVMVEGNPRTEEAIANANIVLRRGIPVIDAKEYFEDIPEILEAAELVVDAIYGTGFHGEFKKTVRKCTKLINEQRDRNIADIKKHIFSLDIPSGLNGDTGEQEKDSVIADYTIAFHRAKPVHTMDEAKAHCGEIVVVDIGI